MEIPKEYTKNGYKWELLKSNNDVGMYYNKDSNSFEVIIIRPNPRYLQEYEIGGVKKVRDNPILLPSNEEFGAFGWSFIHKSNAEAQFEAISKRQNPLN